MSGDFVLFGHFPLWIVKNRETQFEFILKMFHQILRLFETDRQHCQTLLSELQKQLILGGQLPPAIRSEGLEKAQENNLSPVIEKTDFSGIDRR